MKYLRDKFDRVFINSGGINVLNETVSIKKSFAFCRDVARRANANFSYAATLLPVRKREFFYASYAAMRIIDDIVDDEFMVLSQNERRAIREKYHNILKSWLKQVHHLDDKIKGPLDTRVITALQNTVGKSDMGTTQWEGLAGALKMDILESSMRTWNEFINYCEGATVSPASIYIYISASSYKPSEGYTYNLEKSPRYYAKNLAIYCYICLLYTSDAADE